MLTATALIILTLTICTSNAINAFVSSTLLNTIDHRTLLIYTENDTDKARLMEKLGSDDNVIAVFPWISNNGGDIELQHDGIATAGKIYLKPAIPHASPDVVKGENIRESSSKHVGIIPKTFALDQQVNIDIIRTEKEAFIDGETLIGKDITLKYREYADNDRNNGDEEAHYSDYTFTVIGVYDITKTFDSANTVYIPYNDLLALNDSFQKRVTSVLSRPLLIITAM